MQRAKRLAWQWLVLTHRWLAIGLCLLFVAWFASGLVMMYVGFPGLLAAERYRALPPLDWAAVRISPERAMGLAGLEQFPRELHLEMMGGEPVYRIRPAGGPAVTLSARDGRPVADIDPDRAEAIAARFGGTRTAAYVATIERDQWSVAGSYDPYRPLHVVALGDAARTELYVSARDGEVVLDTTGRERFWNRAGAVLHWLYFTELRARPELWRQVVLWTAGLGVYVALSGLWLGIDRLRLRRRYRERSITPWRGWMAWHHVAGVVGGLFLFTWIFSGWLSMDPPLPWSGDFDAERAAQGAAAYAGETSPHFGGALDLSTVRFADARQASFYWLAGAPRILLTDAAERRTLLDGATGRIVSLSDAEVFAAAAVLMPGASLIAAERLEHEDEYWYSHHFPRPLPVLRAAFDDAQRTWIYLEPGTGRVLGRQRAADRAYRWLFDGLHSLDFRWLRTQRPAWDLLMWTLSLGGLAISVSGVVIGWRRLRRQGFRRAGRQPSRRKALVLPRDPA